MNPPLHPRIALLPDMPPESIPAIRSALRVLPDHPRLNRYQPLIASLAATGACDVHVIIETPGLTLPSLTAHDQGVCYHLLRREPYTLAPLYGYRTGIRRIRHLLRAIHPDLVVGFGTEQSLGWLAVNSGYPSIIALQGIMAELSPHLPHWPRWQKWALRRLERAAVKRADGIIAESPFGLDWAHRIVPDTPSFEIPNSLNPAFITLTPVPKISEIWCVGELSTLKNPRMILQAFASLPSTDTTLIFAGTGPLQPVLAGQIGKLGLGNRCRLVGWMDPPTLARHLAAAQMVVLGSWMDSSPNVIIEAHAAGTPVIATRVGGIPARVRDGIDGLLVSPGDQPAMTRAMQTILENPAKAQQMGQAGHSRVLREHAPDRIARLHWEAYAAIIGKCRNCPPVP